mmetsp:Transcript_53187/g.149879  ORF Transcript_53187/g.149879 Transcript_53187/m.149879 type:complete len:757 (+) Transcript_53187:138-2408(+)
MKQGAESSCKGIVQRRAGAPLACVPHARSSVPELVDRWDLLLLAGHVALERPDGLGVLQVHLVKALRVLRLGLGRLRVRVGVQGVAHPVALVRAAVRVNVHALTVFPPAANAADVLVAVREEHHGLALLRRAGEPLRLRRGLARRDEDALLALRAGGCIDLEGRHDHLHELLHELALVPDAHDPGAVLVRDHAAAVLQVLHELADVGLAVRVGLPADLVAIVVLELAGQRGARGPRVAAQAAEQGVLELPDVLVVGDEGDGAPALQVPGVELAGEDGAAARRQRALAAHLAELPLAPVDVRLVGPLEGALAVVEAVEELAGVPGLHGPLQDAVALEDVVLEASLVAADAVDVGPAEHALAVHHLVLELADVAAAVGPLEDAVLEDAVVLQGARVDAAVGPLLGALARGAVVLEDAGDHRAVGEAVAAGAHDLAVVPEALELRAVGPVERAVALELAVVELPFEPGAVGQDLLALALDAVVLELAVVAGAVGPGEPALALADAVLPVADVLDAVGPAHLPAAAHAVLEPVAAIDPALLRVLEGALALLHAVLEAPGVAVAVRPCPGALPVEDALLQGPDVLLAGRPGHAPLAPHHVLPPLAVVGPPRGPSLLALAPHVALVEVAGVVAAVAPDVVALAVHAAVEPGADVGVAVGEDALVLRELVRGGHARRAVHLPRCGRAEVGPVALFRYPVLDVHGVVLAIDVLIDDPRRGLALAVPGPGLVAQRQAHMAVAVRSLGDERHAGVSNRSRGGEGPG